jgi:hypothetical protein
MYEKLKINLSNLDKNEELKGDLSLTSPVS